MAVPKSDIMVLKKFFGMRPGQTSIADFKHEVDELSSGEKKELADLARIELAATDGE